MGYSTEADWGSTSNPKLTSTYTSVIDHIRYRDEDAARQFNDSDNAILGTNHVQGTIRWDGTNSKWVVSNGSGTWTDLVPTGQYSIDVSTVVNCAPNNAAGSNNLSRNNNTLQNNLVSQYLSTSGQDASFFRNASNINAGTISDSYLPNSISSDITGNASTATSINVISNNSTNETTYPLFVDGANGTQGAETDTGFTYNPSTGVLTSTKFLGNLTGNITGNITGNLTGSTVGLDSTDYIHFSNNSTMEFYVNGGERLRLGSNGDLHADGDVIAYSTTISDERLKTGISTVSNALEKVSQLNGVEFTRKNNGQRSAGVIAQQVEKVLPQAIREKKLPLQTGEEDTLYKTVEYDALHSLYIEAIKELKDMVEKQAIQIKDLQGA